jgi:hypothetical protein
MRYFTSYADPCPKMLQISIAVLENVPSGAGLEKRDTFSTLIVGPAGPGYRTRATCVLCSGASRSAIHYLVHFFISLGRTTTGLFSFIEKAKKCSNRSGLDLKFKAIENMLSFLPSQKGQI